MDLDIAEEAWALVKPTLSATEYMPVRILRRGRRYTWVQTVQGAEWRYVTKGLWDGFASYDAAAAEIDRMRRSAADHLRNSRNARTT